ncbi:MAG: hypothetical protein KC619_04005 [Myxococcales bacterium]|nr:hypothetical protein [Myxococcales bacterium]
MSEKDLGLKVLSRALLWRMGYTTRLNVPLRAYIPNEDGKKRAPQTYTDLDVLGYHLTGGSHLHATVVDCKTPSKRATERIFWTRGVADLVGADEAWVVRAKEPPPVTRQLSSRLKVSVLTEAQLHELIALHPTSLPLDGYLARLFNKVQVASAQKHFTSMDARLAPLLSFCQFDYFVNEPHENLFQLVAHVAAVGEHLDAMNPIHCALFFDLAWLQILASVQAISHIRGAHVGDLDTGLREYALGGQVRLQEKKNLAVLLRELAPQGAPPAEPFPQYYEALRETVTRLFKKPAVTLETLRYAEVATATLVANRRTRMRTVFGDAYDMLAAKLVGDVCSYLVSAARLDPEFRRMSSEVLTGESDAGGDGAAPNPPSPG